MGDIRELFKQKEQDRLVYEAEQGQPDFGTKAITVRIDYWHIALADVLAEHTGMSRNEIMKTVLSEGLGQAMAGVLDPYTDKESFKKELSDKAWKLAEKMQKEASE